VRRQPEVKQRRPDYSRTDQTRSQQTRPDQLHRQDRNLSQKNAVQVTEPNLLPHSCQQERVFDSTDCKSHGVLGDQEEKDAFGFIPKLKEDCKSWLFTFVAVLFPDVDKFTDYLKINITIK
jgi:hypothetical protein